MKQVLLILTIINFMVIVALGLQNKEYKEKYSLVKQDSPAILRTIEYTQSEDVAKIHLIKSITTKKGVDHNINLSYTISIKSLESMCEGLVSFKNLYPEG